MFFLFWNVEPINYKFNNLPIQYIIHYSGGLMKNSPKNHPEHTCSIEKESVFDIDSYKFLGSIFQNTEYLKTCINRKLTPSQIQIITKLYHQNMLALKKISKSKRNNDEEVFWLYYEAVPYNIEDAYYKLGYDINPQVLESTLVSMKNYFMAEKFYPEFSHTNIGISENGNIKIYVSAEKILKSARNLKSNSLMSNSVKEVTNWYQKLYCRKSIKPKPGQKSPSDDKQTLNPFKASFKATNPDKPKANVKEQHKEIKQKNQFGGGKVNYAKGNSSLRRTNTMPQENQMDQIYKKRQMRMPIQNINQKTVENFNVCKNKPNIEQIITVPKVMAYDDDNQSIDTYQMEMGDDYQMPSIRTNQKLRHTFLNSGQSWDTLTYKANPIKTPVIEKIHESADDKNFKKMVEDSKKNKEEKKAKDNSFDSKTAVQNKDKCKGWQTSTIKSTLPPNIQDKVQQALTKTKHVMQMLKRTKSSTAATATCN